MTVVTRFAPSPTGYLHIGGARTALFNWLLARRHEAEGGRFYLRIEDTDRARSTQAAIDALIDGLSWLGLCWDGDPVFQFARRQRHREVAESLLAQGLAYRCYCTPEELADMRAAARAAGQPVQYDGRWRDRDPAEAPAGVAPALRFRAPRDGDTTLDDAVQGSVTVRNSQLDDMVLLRADGTPTYMLSVVVDDRDMGITHVIRGDDHLTNAFRQYQLFKAIGATPPRFGHIPLIHGPDGGKLSKRHGALGVEVYRDQGFLPEAVRNYLLRLGWAHGDAEIISTEQAIAWFDLDGVGRAPARLDMAKALHVNAHYIRHCAPEALLGPVSRLLTDRLPTPLGDEGRARLLRALPGLQPRARTLLELADNAAFYFRARPLAIDDKAARLLDGTGCAHIQAVRTAIEALSDWTDTALEEAVRNVAYTREVKLGKVAQPLRAALTGSTASPSLFDVMVVLGRQETLGRLADALAGNTD